MEAEFSEMQPNRGQAEAERAPKPNQPPPTNWTRRLRNLSQSMPGTAHPEITCQVSFGLKPDVPTAVSRGWFSDMKIKIGIKDSAVASAEVRRLTITDEKVFWDGYKEKVTNHNIQITNVFSL